MSGQVRVSTLVGRTLAKLGVGHVFGVVGSGNFDVTGTLMAEGIPFTAARHEGGAATMADAYSRMSGKVGVVTTHQGCGLSNAITGIGEAAKSRTPMIVLTADTQAAAIRSNFKIDQDGLARSVGATAERIHSPATAVTDTVRAFRTAVNERRTVVLSLPLDIQNATTSTSTASDEVGAVVVPEPLKVRPDAAAVEQLVALISAAERPVFVAGRGGRGARDEILALARHAGALVATSAVASGLFNGDSHNLGISGGFSSPVTAELISSADLIVGWGCALNMWTMRHGRLISAGTKVVQIDVEDSALGANRPITLGVLGDSGLTASDALAALAVVQPEPAEKYRTEANALAIKQSSRWRDVTTEDLSTATTIDPRVLTRELDSLLPAERIVAVDSGNFMGYPSQYLAVPDEFGFCFTQAFQAIGLGLSHSHRRGPGPTPPPARPRSRRWRLPDGHQRVGDRRPVETATGVHRLQRRRLRSRSAPLRVRAHRSRARQRRVPRHRHRRHSPWIRRRRRNRPDLGGPRSSTPLDRGLRSRNPRPATGDRREDRLRRRLMVASRSIPRPLRAGLPTESH
jgi:thiamine pyrophosphate-dependent acetolactate synthase large subunit-like protein